MVLFVVPPTPPCVRSAGSAMFFPLSFHEAFCLDAVRVESKHPSLSTQNKTEFHFRSKRKMSARDISEVQLIVSIYKNIAAPPLGDFASPYSLLALSTLQPTPIRTHPFASCISYIASIFFCTQYFLCSLYDTTTRLLLRVLGAGQRTWQLHNQYCTVLYSIVSTVQYTYERRAKYLAVPIMTICPAKCGG